MEDRNGGKPELENSIFKIYSALTINWLKALIDDLLPYGSVQVSIIYLRLHQLWEQIRNDS